jgi:2,5-furandicarboxylate decarboxylase 1
VIVHSEEDGGPYIGSAMCVTKDPDTGIQNVAMLRMQIQDRNRTGTAFAPRHSWMHYQKYEARNEPMPMAAVIGHHPILDLATNSSVPYGVDEFQVAGSLLQEPLEMVRCETVDLMVPAHAEIVIEGMIPPGIREDEGPFGEFQCYYLTRTRKCPIFDVKAITMRRDALYRHIQATPSTVEHQALVAVPMEAHLWQRIKDVDGYIDLKDVHVPPWGACFVVLVKFTPRLEEQAKSVLMAALSISYAHPKIAIALDDDIDLTDPRDVFWAVATRVDPARDLLQIPLARMHSLDPSGKLVPRREPATKGSGESWESMPPSRPYAGQRTDMTGSAFCPWVTAASAFSKCWALSHLLKEGCDEEACSNSYSGARLRCHHGLQRRTRFCGWIQRAFSQRRSALGRA